MKNNILLFFLFIAGSFIFSACNTKIAEQQEIHETEPHEEDGTVALTRRQQKAIGIEWGYIEDRNLHTSISITGRLELPPQYKAVVSAFVGGNVQQVKVIEGDYVKKGEALTVLTHPDYIDLQQNFMQLNSSLTYLKEEYQRKKTLYEKQISSAKAYQKAAAEYHSTMAQYEGLKEKLQLLGLSPDAVLKGNISASIIVRSPISGYVKAININTGQYAVPQTGMFEITNNAHVHADFMVYEKDADKVHKGQIIRFTVANLSDKVLKAKVFSVGKSIENDPRAIHIHAKVIDPDVDLIPGMYINGRLRVSDHKVKSLPQKAVVKVGDRHYIFVKKATTPDSENPEESTTVFKRVEVATGVTDQGFTEIRLLQPVPDSAAVVIAGAYYLIADMTREQNEHSH